MQALSEVGALKAADQAVALSQLGLGGAAIQVTSTFVGTITFEGSVDGQNFRALLASPSNSATQVTTATSVGLWFVNTTGLTVVRARMSSYTSGSATVVLKAVPSSPSSGSSGGGGGGGTSSTFGAAFPGDGTAAGFLDSLGNMSPLELEADGSIPVTVLSGGGSNASVGATGAAVPASATFLGVDDGAGALVGVALAKFDYDTTGPVTVPQSAIGIALPTALGPVAGGTAANPIRVDPTGTTTQPVSAAALPLPTGAATEATLSALNGKVTAVNTGAVVVASGSITANAGTNLNTSALALEATLSSLNAKVTVVNTGAVVVASSALPSGASTLTEQQTQTASLSVLDDWDESDRAKVNTIAGQVGVQGGAGASTALTQRVAIATDANAVKDGGPSGTLFSVHHIPSANTQATISQASAGGGVKNVCTGFTVTLAATASAPAAVQITVSLIDGATSGTTYLWRTVISLPAVAGAITSFTKSGLWIAGTAATAMTLEFSAAGGANTQESVSLQGTTTT